MFLVEDTASLQDLSNRLPNKPTEELEKSVTGEF